MGALSEPGTAGVVEGPAIEVTRERIGLYAEITNDFNPLHLDEAFARTTPFGGVIAHGMLSLNVAWELLAGLGLVEGTTVQVRFRKPVRPGDVVRARARRQDAGWTLWIENQRGETVIEGSVR